MNSRATRMSGKNVWARLDRLIGEVSNISLTGALLVLDEPFPADRVATLTLIRRSAGLTVEVRVIRSAQEKSSSRWVRGRDVSQPVRPDEKGDT